MLHKTVTSSMLLVNNAFIVWKNIRSLLRFGKCSWMSELPWMWQQRATFLCSLWHENALFPSVKPLSRREKHSELHVVSASYLVVQLSHMMCIELAPRILILTFFKNLFIKFEWHSTFWEIWYFFFLILNLNQTQQKEDWHIEYTILNIK